MRAALATVAAAVALCFGTLVRCGGPSSGASSDAEPGAEGAATVGTSNDSGDSSPMAADAILPTEAAPACATTSDWSGWRRLTELDPCCAVDVPTNITSAVPALSWMPCADAGPGCSELQVPPKGPGLPPNIFYASVTRNETSGAPQNFLLGWTLASNPTTYQYAVFDFASGTPLASWRAELLQFPTDCQINAFAYGNAVSILSGNAPYRLGSATPQSWMTSPSFRVIGGSELDGVQGQGTSDTVFAFDRALYGVLDRVDIASNTVVTTAGKQAVANGAMLALDFVTGNDVYATNGLSVGPWQQEFLVNPDGTVILYRAKLNRNVGTFATDGTTMFWVENYGGATPSAAPATVEVWAAPYTSNPTQLDATATKVATIPGAGEATGNLIAFQGLFVMDPHIFSPSTGGAIEVVRHSDGALKQVFAGPGLYFSRFVYVSQTEFWGVVTNSRGVSDFALRRFSLGNW
jgi:hypothetical protein